MEADVVAAIRKEVLRRGGWVFKVHGSSMQEKGIPDLVGCLECPACPSARFFAIEAKRPGAKPRPDEAAQRIVQRLIAAAKGCVTVAASKAEAVAFLDHVQRRSPPVCFTTPDLQWSVEPDRKARAMKMFVDYKKVLTETEVLSVITEIGLGDLVYYSEDGLRLVANLSDLQIVSCAAALHAVATGGRTQVDHSGLDEA